MLLSSWYEMTAYPRSSVSVKVLYSNHLNPLYTDGLFHDTLILGWLIMHIKRSLVRISIFRFI